MAAVGGGSSRLEKVVKPRGSCRLWERLVRADPDSDAARALESQFLLSVNAIATGLGHELFEFALETCRKEGFAGMLLWTLEGNTRARRFYEAHGMVHDGARADEPEWLGPGVFEVRYQCRFEES